MTLACKLTLAHAYYFAFAEMSYNFTDKQYEATLIVSTHDIEEYFQKNGIAVTELEDAIGNDSLLTEMTNLLTKYFQVTVFYKRLQFSAIGYEVLDNGLTHFYLHSNQTDRTSNLIVSYDLLMNEYPEQQNKITYIEGENTYTAVFTQTRKRNQIIIE
jgi:hypothetical protein